MEKRGTTKQAIDDNVERCMLFACWKTKAIDTHSEYVIFIVLPQQQWFFKRLSVYAVCSTYVAHYASCFMYVCVCVCVYIPDPTTCYSYTKLINGNHYYFLQSFPGKVNAFVQDAI